MKAFQALLELLPHGRQLIIDRGAGTTAAAAAARRRQGLLALQLRQLIVDGTARL